MTTIQVGKSTFHDTVADSNSLFRVIRKLPDGIYECVSEGDEYAGTERYFSTAQLRDKLKWEQSMGRLFKRQDDYWSTRRVGEVLHYCNGFGQFIRGEVRKIDGEFKLMPIAMVGEWKGFHDLPRRRPDGEIHYGLHAKKIIDGDESGAWQPNEGCVYESPTCSSSYSHGVDPRTLPALDLSVPLMTPEEEAIANLEQRINRIRAVLENRYQTSEPAQNVLTAIKEIVNG